MADFTNLVTNPSGEATSGTVVVRENLAYTAGTASNPELDISTYVGGPENTTVFRGVRNSTTAVAIYFMDTARPPVTVGETYTASFLARSSVAKALQLRMAWYGNTSSSDRTSVTVVADEWTYFEHTAVAPAGVSTFRLDLVDGGTGAFGDVLEATAPMLTVGDGSQHGEWFDGSFSPDPDLTPQWTGTPDASTSRLVGQVPTVVYDVSGQTVTYQHTEPDGNETLRHMIVSALAVGLNWTNNSSTLGIVAGGTYTMLARVRPSRDMEVAARIGVALAEEVSLGVLPADQWSTVRATMVAGTAYVGFALRGADHDYGDYVDVDDRLLVEGEYTGPYFDGDTPDVRGVNGFGWVYEWTGAPDASTSTADYVPWPGIAVEPVTDPVPAVGVTVTGLDTEAASLVTVERAVPGEGWVQVPGMVRRSVTGGMYDVDYTAPLQVPVTYRLTVDGAVQPENLQAIITVPSDVCWLQDPVNPYTGVPISTVIGYGGAPYFAADSFTRLMRELPGTVQQVVGSGAPVGMGGTRQAPALAIHVVTQALADSNRLRTLLTTAYPLMLRVVPPLTHIPAVTFLHASLEEAPLWEAAPHNGHRENWLLEGQAVRPPRFHVLVPRWTYGDVAALWETYGQAVAEKGGTYLDWVRDPSPGVGVG